jgi:hypothetical protein
MLKRKNNEYKLKHKTLEEQVLSLSSQLSQANNIIERSKAEINLLKDENKELKLKLLNTTVEVGKYKKICENNPQMAEIEDPPIEVADSEDESMANFEMNFEELPQRSGQIFQCNYCPKTYLQEKRLNSHMVKKHQEPTSVSTSGQRGQNCTTKFFCPQNGCNFSCNYGPAFNRHVNSHNLQKYKCHVEKCKYESPYEKRMRNHMQNKHQIIPDSLPDGNEFPQFTLHQNPDFISMIRSNSSGGQVRKKL